MNPAGQAASAAIASRRAELAEAMVAAEFARHPGLEQRYGPDGRRKCLMDADYHLGYLGEALAFDSPALFVDYIAWAKVMLAKRGMPAGDLAAFFECTALVLRERLPGEPGAVAASLVDIALQAMPAMPEDLPGRTLEENPLSLLAHQYEQALLRGDRLVASRLVIEAAARGTPVSDIYLQVFQPTQYEVGRLWQVNEINVAKEHYCTAATQLVMSQLYPHLFTEKRRGRSLVATSVAGNLHELGARMVCDFFEMAGWDTCYLGANTPHGAVIQALAEQRADMLAVSATLATQLGEVQALISAVRADPGLAKVKILVGGHPFNRDPDLWRQVGADGTAADAQEGILVAERLLL